MNTPFNPSGTKFDDKPVKKRGFATLDHETMRDVAARGGRSAHAMGKAHEFTPEKAREAALKMHANRKAKKEAEAEAKANNVGLSLK